MENLFEKTKIQTETAWLFSHLNDLSHEHKFQMLFDSALLKNII